MSKRTRMSRVDKVFQGLGRRKAFVGLDVHKKTIHVALWAGGRIVATWVMPAQVDKVVAMLLPHRSAIRQMVYEAGPTGYALARAARHAEAVALARTHPGVGAVVAMSYLVEVHRGGRFNEPGEVASYIGLAPRVRQSGQSRRDGPIVRTGRASVRALLVEAAWRWRVRDPSARRVFARLMHNTGSAKKAIVALARRLAVNLWAMLTRRAAYRAAA